MAGERVPPGGRAYYADAMWPHAAAVLGIVKIIGNFAHIACDEWQRPHN